MWWLHPSPWFAISICPRSARWNLSQTDPWLDPCELFRAQNHTVQGSTLRATFVLLIAALLGSCSISEHVVQDGPFQKRKYFKRGWFFDPPSRSGLEELVVDALPNEEVPIEADPYLHALAADRLEPEELVETHLPELHLSSIGASGQNIQRPTGDKGGSVQSSTAAMP